MDRNDRRDKSSRLEHTQPQEPHELSMSNREKMTMTGVKEVESFNEAEIRLDTVQGPCVINGEMLTIQVLSLETGRLVVAGQIVTIDYSVKGAKGKGLINRIFK